MLWNWYTIDACFIARSWRIRSNGAFAGSCIGVIFLVIALEFLRRTQREFDRYVRASNRQQALDRSSSDSGSGDATAVDAKGIAVRVRAFAHVHAGTPIGSSRLKLWQHMIRSLLYMLQFAVGYFVMLLAMYYNGMCIPPPSPFWRHLDMDVRGWSGFLHGADHASVTNHGGIDG